MFLDFAEALSSLYGNIDYEVMVILNFLFLGMIYAYLKFSPHKGSNLQELYLAMGFKAGLGPAKMVIKDNYVCFHEIPPMAMTESFWSSKFDLLSNFLNESVIDVKISGQYAHRKMAKVIFDRLPKSFTTDFSKLKLNPMDIYLGVNQYGKDVTVSLMDNAAIYIDGKPGSGKSVALKSIIESYLRSFGNEIAQSPLEVFIITTKTGDFTYLKRRPEIKLILIDIFDPNSTLSNQCQLIIDSLGELKEAQKEFNQIIESLSLTDASNIERLRQRGEMVSFPRRLYIFDEAKDYLSREKGDSKEEAESKIKLIKVIGTHLRRNARFLSTPIIVAAQVQNENDLDISLKSFHLRLCSNTNEAMSRQLSGSTLLTDPSFTKGKFFLKTQIDEHILRVSLIK